jgi:hypothetical protein
MARYGDAIHACMVASGGAVHVSNAWPVYRVALAHAGYATVVAGSAMAGDATAMTASKAAEMASGARQ